MLRGERREDRRIEERKGVRVTERRTNESCRGERRRGKER